MLDPIKSKSVFRYDEAGQPVELDFTALGIPDPQLWTEGGFVEVSPRRAVPTNRAPMLHRVHIGEVTEWCAENVFSEMVITYSTGVVFHFADPKEAIHFKMRFSP